MRTEFTNRMRIQREVLDMINHLPSNKEELCGLSEKSITRWATSAKLSQDDAVVELLQKISDTIAFLATKSQDQVSESYKQTISEVPKFVLLLKDELRNR